MKILFLFLVLVLGFGHLAGCLNQLETDWEFHVIDKEVTVYTLGDITGMETSIIKETVIKKEIKKVEWEGVLATEFGEGDTINFISEDRYLVSIPSGVDVIVAFKKDENPISEMDGGPLKIAVDPNYGCKCNWLKYVKIVEFVDSEESFSVYGNVFNLLTFSPRDLNLHYGLQEVIQNTYTKAPLQFILDKAICKENATTIVFVTEEGRVSYSLEEIEGKNLVVIYDNGFHIEGLNIRNLKGIKIE
ncbi:MAG: molybdopterin-dependent oxidoreductase [Candidatus Methanofastidiosia archaeon]|jgi:hypothetical protein